MSGILQQLGLDQSFFTQLVIFGIVFFFLSSLYFKPVAKLFQARHKRLVEDKEAAENLVAQANAKFEDYKRKLAEERAIARKQYEELINETKKEEAQILNNARNEAKKITQEAADSVNQQRDRIKKQLENDVEGLAKAISESLLVRKD